MREINRYLSHNVLDFVSVDPNALNQNFGSGGFGQTDTGSTNQSTFDPNHVNDGFGMMNTGDNSTGGFGTGFGTDSGFGTGYGCSFCFSA